MTTTTFVSAFISLNNFDELSEKNTFQWRLDRFKEIASTGIQLCIFVSRQYENIIREFCLEFPNVKIIRFLNLEETWAYKTCIMLKEQGIDYTLPLNRCESKDNEEYMKCINSKVDFVQETMKINPWNSTHFAWIDFSLSYIFNNNNNNNNKYSKNKSKEALYYLQTIGKIPFTKRFFVIPGCWHKDQTEILNQVNWRFCGGFFIADKESMEIFCNESKSAFIELITKHHLLTWEVNVWTFLENTSTQWIPFWYFVNFDNTMIQNFPYEYLYYTLTHDKFANPNIVKYHYPSINGFLPSSASYLEYNGKHWLNTRYVNYFHQIMDYYSLDGSNKIHNKNIVSELIVNGECNQLIPVSYKEMDITSVGLPENENSGSFGLEDVRLYEYNGRCRFIATSINYSPVLDKNRMVVGDFDMVNCIYTNSVVIHSPYPENSNPEKNWVPIIQKQDKNDTRERFIYKWKPFEIGYLQKSRINGEMNLVIDERCTFEHPLFCGIRGSTIFQYTDEGYLGTVHYSTNSQNGAVYYHMLMLLDSDTFKPLRFSPPFVFCKLSIEFCIGMRIESDTYTFWISQIDRDPIVIKVSKDSIPINIDVF